MQSPDMNAKTVKLDHQQQAYRRADLERRALYTAPVEIDDDTPRHYNEGLAWTDLIGQR